MTKNLSISGILTGILIFIMPFIHSDKLFYGSLNARYFFILGFTYIIAFIFVQKLFTNKINLRCKSSKLSKILLGTFLVFLVSSFLGSHLGQSLWSDILRGTGVVLMAHIGLLIVMLSELLNKKDWVFLRRSFIVSSVIFSAIYFFGMEGLGYNWRFLTINLDFAGASLGNPTFAASYLFFPLILTIFEINRSKKWGKEFWMWIIFFLIQFLSPLFFNFDILQGEVALKEIFSNPKELLGSSRASSATAILVIIYFLIRSLIKKITINQKVLKTYSYGWLLAICVSVSLLFVSGSFVQDAYINESTAARPIVWNIGWQGFLERPIFGWGPENFEFSFQRYFNNDLYLPQNIGEVWFDRAHNVFVDRLNEVGVVGLFMLILLAIYTTKAFYKGRISKEEANVFAVLIVGNLLQLQTSFDTILTYFAMVFVIGYALWLEKEKISESVKPIKEDVKKTIAGVISSLVVLSLIFAFGKELIWQKNLYKIFVESESENRVELIEKALKRPSSFESLRLGYSSLIGGTRAAIAEGPLEITLVESIKEELGTFENAFIRYIEKTPNDYRARMNFAYLLYFQSYLDNFEDVERIERGREVVSPGYEMSPENPLTYVVDSLSYTYTNQPEKAEEILNEGLSLNQLIPFTNAVYDRLQQQKDLYPEIRFLGLTNI